MKITLKKTCHKSIAPVTKRKSMTSLAQLYIQTIFDKVNSKSSNIVELIPNFANYIDIITMAAFTSTKLQNFETIWMKYISWSTDDVVNIKCCYRSMVYS